MALPILDGNQSATTLSSILTSGEHIPAHTVVSLGTQAITDISGAVSGSVVSISNFPATQPVSIASVTIGSLPNVKIQGFNGAGGGQYLDVGVTEQGSLAVVLDEALPAGTAQIGSVTASISGTVPISISSVTVGNSVTIGSLPAISGTVTANVGNPSSIIGGGYNDLFAIIDDSSFRVEVTALPAFPALSTGTNRIGVVTIGAGTVTIGAGTAQIGSVTASISNSVTIASLPAISGTVTANVPDLALVVGENQNTPNPAHGIQIGYLSDISGTFVNVSDDTSGYQQLPIKGTVTANTFAVQGTAVTTSNFTSTTASTVLANYNATRKVLTIFNEGAGNLHVCAGATCTTIAYQVRLSSGDYYEVPNHQTTITHSAVFATAGTARVTQVS